MFLFKEPSKADIEQFLAAASLSDPAYAHIGATNTEPPRRYIVDHNRIELAGDWEAAKRAIRERQMFDFDWVEIFPKNTPIETRRNVAILIRHFGFYSLNAARIVYTINEPDRFGFAYGTLQDHGESGEERFTVERDNEGTIVYDLYAFSRPNHLLARIGFPLTRKLQRSFAEDSKRAMARTTLKSA